MVLSGQRYSGKCSLKASLHLVAAESVMHAKFRHYDHLFMKLDPDDLEEGESCPDNLNSNALKVVRGLVESGVADSAPRTLPVRALRLLVR